MNAEEASWLLMEGKPLRVQANGETFDILPEEVEVKALAKEGFAVAEDGPYVAALVTDLTPELVREGLAREFVRRVQDLRKTAELDVADRIELYVDASPGLRSAIEAHREYITTETLSTRLEFADPPEGASVIEEAFDGEKVTAGLKRK